MDGMRSRSLTRTSASTASSRSSACKWSSGLTTLKNLSGIRTPAFEIECDGGCREGNRCRSPTQHIACGVQPNRVVNSFSWSWRVKGLHWCFGSAALEEGGPGEDEGNSDEHSKFRMNLKRRTWSNLGHNELTGPAPRIDRASSTLAGTHLRPSSLPPDLCPTARRRQ